MPLTAVTVTSLRQKLRVYLDRVSSSLETLIVMRGSNENEAVVIMSLDTYNSLTETNYLLSTEKNRERLMTAMQEETSGRTTVVTLDDLDKAIKAAQKTPRKG
jgi:antitoxin YefM